MKKPVTWFLIADGARARIVTRSDPDSRYEVIYAEDSSTMHARARDLVSDRPGRTQESAYSGRHALEPRHDVRRAEESKFVKDVAAHINSESARNRFDRLVIYAAPQCLSVLRAALDPGAMKKLHGEYAKDLTKVPVEELPAHFGAA
jgi:protein required for attachment to host cells